MRQVIIEFNDQSSKTTGQPYDSISYGLYAGDERLRVEMIDGVPMVWGNPSGLKKVAEILLQIATSPYRPGFHIHLYENLNANRNDALGIGLRKSE